MRRLATALILALGLSLSWGYAEAATTTLSPEPVLHFVDNNGNPLVGGKLFTYSAGTTSPLATYTDSTGTVPNSNPVVLNTRGEANVWINPALAYKFVLSPSTDTNPPTNPIWTVDNINSLIASNFGISVPCLGSTDVAASIQSAVNLGEAGTGATITLGAGICTTKSSVSITGSGIHINGQGPSATVITPVGNFNAFSFSGTSSVQDGGMTNLSFNATGLTGGQDIFVSDYQRTRFSNISAFNTLNFLENRSSNWMDVENVQVFSISGSYCFEVDAPGSARSDDMNFTNVACGGGVGSTYVGLIANGFVNTINIQGFAVSTPDGEGILSENTNSGSTPPTFWIIHNFQTELGSGFAGIDLEAALIFYCADCYSASNTNDGLYVSNSSSDVSFVNPIIELNHKYGVETYASSGGTGARGTTIVGGNVSGNSNQNSGTYSNVLAGSTSNNTIVSGVQLGGSTVGYSVIIQSGAAEVTLSGNNYVGATVAAVHDLSGIASILGGTDITGGPFGPTFQDGPTTGNKAVVITNIGTSSGTASSQTEATGTTNAYTTTANTDGSTPAGFTATGPGDTGGYQLVTGAGPITLSPASGQAIIATKPIRLQSYTVSTLPSCVSGLAGGYAYVTDASSPTYNGSLTGSSSTIVPVFCNGSAWTSH